MKLQMMVFDKRTKAMKAGANIDTEKPEECLSLMRSLFKSGGNIAEGMSVIPKKDKQKVFNYLNDKNAVPDSKYDNLNDMIHESLGLELKDD